VRMSFAQTKRLVKQFPGNEKTTKDQAQGGVSQRAW